LIRDSLAPLLAVTLFRRATTYGDPLAVPLFLLDDTNALDGTAWEVVVRAYGAGLRPVKQSRFVGAGSVKHVTKLGEFTLTADQTKTAPLLIVTDVKKSGALVKRHYYFTNFAPVKDCLFDLPKTSVSLQASENHVIVRNAGKLPAVGVNVSRPGHLDTFFTEENYFWLEPGEAWKVAVNTTDGVVVDAWNI
jgi:hypothetical protein